MKAVPAGLSGGSLLTGNRYSLWFCSRSRTSVFLSQEVRPLISVSLALRGRCPAAGSRASGGAMSAALAQPPFTLRDGDRVKGCLVSGERLCAPQRPGALLPEHSKLQPGGGIRSLLQAQASPPPQGGPAHQCVR